MGVSFCLLSQTLMSLFLCIIKSLFDSNFFEKIHPSHRKTRNKLWQMCGWSSGGLEENLYDTKDGGGSKQNKTKQKSDEEKRYGSIFFSLFPRLGIEEVCLFLDSKNKRLGFILAPWRPCHARMTWTVRRHQRKNSTLSFSCFCFCVSVSKPLLPHRLPQLLQLLQASLQKTLGSSFLFFFYSCNSLLFWGSHTIFFLKKKKKRFKPMFLLLVLMQLFFLKNR